MTYEEAVNMKTYRNYCNCGGYASMSERTQSKTPHVTWCAQYEEFMAREEALHRGRGLSVAPTPEEK